MSPVNSQATVARIKADAAYQLALIASGRVDDMDVRLRTYMSAQYAWDDRTRTFWSRLRWLVWGS